MRLLEFLKAGFIEGKLFNGGVLKRCIILIFFVYLLYSVGCLEIECKFLFFKSSFKHQLFIITGNLFMYTNI